MWLDVTLETMPLFVRAGSVIPEYPVIQHTGERHSDHLNLVMYYADYLVNSFLYEDHGDTFAYEQDIYTEKKFVLTGDATSMRVEQSSLGMFTPTYDTYHIKLIGLPFAPKEVLWDGKKVKDVVVDSVTGVVNFVVFKSFKVLEVK